MQTLLTEPALLLADDMGLGKAQPLDAKVLTPQGWKRMGEIEAGDPVINSQGGVSTVLGVYPHGEKDIYRVVFSDGSATECSDDHLWHVTSAVRRHRRQPGQVLPLHTIRARLFDGAGNARHYIPMVRPIEFREGCLPIHPYLLGALLGDGGFRHRAIFTSADEELVERLKSLLPDGVDIRPIGRFDFRISRKPSLYRNPVITALRDLGLFGHGSSTKFIPADYKFASVASRTALLQGLLDTDGCVRPTDNSIEYTTASRQLADDVAFIVQSLGGRATVRLKSPRYRHNGELRHGKTAYRMSVILPRGIEPFALSRKADIYNPRPKYQPSRAIRDVVYVGRKRAQCIRVDAPDGLYITDDCIVTHNTAQSIAAMRILMLQRRIGAALIV
ncbi:MAG: LAGLIDADG family homing endonuclease, partial [Dehalococcoidia bacterium]